ncbi:glycoside hydrolase family 95 protein [Parabacteroides goldsteinii]|jgi:alpha-L-fucosidase 2|uniref:glycoside hydrolase family 95 protein n=1 Tax=Parabacteroides goldsteinii TaxID=328812 RepID=UPI001D93DBEC|nr:glycoside hydrolase family 95 protein [Parabacteroides goldsteinii]MBS6576488.1 glycoside hydrolase family 95 protein [Parabacteroides goldsteinii]
MGNTFIKVIRYLLPVALLSCAGGQPPAKNLSSTILYMDQPAASWYEATPIGNGRLGGMVYGGVTKDTIRTNDDTFWSGEPRDLQRPGAYKCLPEIRKLLLEEKNLEAQELIDKHMLGPWNQNYMPLADILLEWPGDGNVSGYRRELDLNRGVVTITYTQNGVNYKRELFASYPDQALVMNISADKENAVEFIAGLGSQINNQTKVEGDQIVINGQAPWHTDPNYTGVHPPVYKEGKGMRFEGRLLVKQEGGTISAQDDKLHVKDAASATITFVAATSFNGFDKDPAVNERDEKAICKKYLSSLETKKYPDLYKAHLADYSSLFGRVSIDLGESPESNLPINQRIKNYKPGMDPALTALYFQFGRYLLISASRPGSQPANLQGIWNQDMQPAWSANWTINCNAEINYWPAEITNLSECHFPMFDMIRETSVDGARTAKNLYNSRGWIAHHNLDIWRTTWMVGGTGLYSLFQVGGAWLCQHIWEHYLFTLDKDFLHNHYDLLKSASIFYLDNLQTDRDGYLVTSPSESFENGYIKPNGEKGWACIGSAQDMQIIRALFENTMNAAEILNDGAFKEEVAKAYAKLPPMKISPRTGQLQEWNDDWEPSNPASGQVGHGWAFAVGNQITLRGTPELAQAFRKTIEYRRPGYSYNSGSWTGSFPAVYWARFEEPDSVQRVIDRHFDLALSPNLTCEFMKSWQIDGNLGITTAITEMLLQSHAGEISLLPALPAKYPTGSVTGLRARGGYKVDIFWKDGVLTKAVIKADRTKKDKIIPVRYAGLVKSVKLAKGQTIVLNSSLE